MTDDINEQMYQIADTWSQKLFESLINGRNTAYEKTKSIPFADNLVLNAGIYLLLRIVLKMIESTKEDGLSPQESKDIQLEIHEAVSKLFAEIIINKVGGNSKYIIVDRENFRREKKENESTDGPLNET